VTRPTAFLLRMLVFLVAVAAVAGLLSTALVRAFDNNRLLNSLILVVLAIGVFWNLRQVIRLGPEVRWLEAWQRKQPRKVSVPAPRLLAPMAAMLAARAKTGSDRLTLSSQAMRALLDTIASRLDESRELSRYMTGLLIFLGLLGTFWGLLLTVSSVGDVINNMSVGNADITAMFAQLKLGLARPLKGMGTAFSSSMLGLAGALVLGFLDLTAGQAQNRFYNELEEWLAGITRLSSGLLGGEGDTSVPAYVQALLEQTAENMEQLQRVLTRGEEGRREANQAVVALTERMANFSETMRASQQLMIHLAENQQAMVPLLQRLGERRTDPEEALRGHLRNIELYMQRLLSESEQGRAQSTAELRADIRILTRTIAALAEEPPR
jgi:hypothetical protein